MPCAVRTSAAQSLFIRIRSASDAFGFASFSRSQSVWLSWQESYDTHRHGSPAHGPRQSSPAGYATCGCAVDATSPALIDSSRPGAPETKPLSWCLNTEPFSASRKPSLNAATPRSRRTFVFIARFACGSGESPPVQPSPYRMIDGSTRSSAARIARIVCRSCRPIRSKRNPSTWHSRAQ